MRYSCPPTICKAVAMLLAFGTLAASGPTQAASQVVPFARAGVSHVKVQTNGSEGSSNDTGAQIEAKARIETAGPNWSISLVPKILQTFYDDESLGREEQRITAIGRNSFETGDYRVVLGYSRQDLFSSEFTDIDDDPDDELTDVDNSSGVAGSGTRNRLMMRGELNKDMSQRVSFIIDGAYQDNSYDQDSGIPRVGFAQLIGNAGLSLQQSERVSYRITGGGRKYSNDSDIDVDSLRVDARVDYELSQVSSIFGSIGYEKLEATQNGATLEEETIVPWHAGLSYRMRLTVYSFEFQHMARPISIGEVRDRLQFSARVSKQFTPRFLAKFGINTFKDESLSDNADENSRTYLAAKIDLQWALSQKWFVGFEYFYNDQRFDGEAIPLSGIKSRNEIFLNLRYQAQDRLKHLSSRR